MLKDILIGQYYPAPSPVHRLDPRTKILVTFLYVILLFFINTFTGFAAAAVFTGAVVLVGQVPWRLLLRSLRPILLLMAFTLIFHALVTGGPQAQTIARWGPVTVTDEGLYQGAFLGLRLALLILTSSLLTLTTSPVELTDGLERLLLPAGRLGLPAHEFAMMMTIALRFIPTLLEEAEKIMKAQMARGADFQGGNLVQRARALLPILVPLFVSAFRRADDLALAMEARCYRGGEGRSRYRVLRFKEGDLVAWAVTAVFFAGILWLGRQGGRL